MICYDKLLHKVNTFNWNMLNELVRRNVVVMSLFVLFQPQGFSVYAMPSHRAGLVGSPGNVWQKTYLMWLPRKLYLLVLTLLLVLHLLKCQPQLNHQRNHQV